MSDEPTGAQIMAKWNEGDTVGDAFTLDHAKQLSDRILQINRQYDLELVQAAKLENVPCGAVSMRMTRLYAERDANIDLACMRMMGQMNATVAHFQRLATEAVNRYPGPTIELYPQPKPGVTTTVVKSDEEHS